MADPKQFTTGSLSQGGASRTAAPVGTSHGEPNVSRVVEEAKEVGNELIGAVREGATSFLEEQRNRAASEIASVGEMLRQSARGLDQNRATAISRYTEKAADEITQFADRLRRRHDGRGRRRFRAALAGWLHGGGRRRRLPRRAVPDRLRLPLAITDDGSVLVAPDILDGRPSRRRAP
jgi:hypothetical protein